MPNLVLLAVYMTEILHIEVFIYRTHRHTHRHTDRQGHLNTSQPRPGRGNHVNEIGYIEYQERYDSPFGQIGNQRNSSVTC